jgi:hypothetical protein
MRAETWANKGPLSFVSKRCEFGWTCLNPTENPFLFLLITCMWGGGGWGGFICTRALVAGRYQGTPDTPPLEQIAHLLGDDRSPANTDNKGWRSTNEKVHTAKGIRSG